MSDLRTLIEQLGLSQVGLARELGTDGRNVRRYISGDRDSGYLKPMLRAVLEIRERTGESTSVIIGRLIARSEGDAEADS